MLLKETYVIPDGDLSRTFEEDEKLPSLPLPSLSDTIQTYLDSVKPFASNNNEYKKTVKVTKEFEEGIGKLLHSKLLKKAQNERNWLTRFWEDYAYLTLREPLLPYYSMVGYRSLLPMENYKRGQQIKFASLDCYHIVQLWILLRTESLKPMKASNNKPFSMAQYRRLFNCVRVPGEHKDTIRSYFKTEREGTCSSKIIVIKNGHVFAINGLFRDGTPLTPTEWSKQLKIIQIIANTQRGSCIPLLTCDYRTSWAKNREYLLKLGNKQSLSIIESAMFVLCLDDDCPMSESDILHFCLNGDYTCRWSDKSTNMISFDNGLPGGFSEHSAFDGIVTSTLIHFIDLKLEEDFDYWQNSEHVREGLEEPVEIEIIVDSYIDNEIQKLLQKLDIEKHRFIIVRHGFKDFGKEAVQKVKVHPDSFVQMALQLAYYKLHSRPASCYETATTRTFYNGRTETVRSCTMEVIAWINAMLDSSAENKLKADLLRKAVEKHDQLMAKAKKNEGCDRHLFGLYCTAVEEGLDIPYFFKDPLYTKSGGGGNFLLSTSLTGYISVGGGVAPMCFDGYGVFYCITSKSIYFTLSVTRDSFETSTNKYFLSLCESLKEMRVILEDDPKAKL